MDIQTPYTFSTYNKPITLGELRNEHIRTILRLTANEFRGGYYDENIVKVDGQLVTKKVYVPDTRQQYINAVIGLYDLLRAENLSEQGEEHMGKCADIIKEIEQLYNKYIEALPNQIKPISFRYAYISNKLRLSQKLFRELMVVVGLKTKIDPNAFIDRVGSEEDEE